MNRADPRRPTTGTADAEVGDLLRRARREYNAGRLGQAASLYEKALALHPGHPEASNSLGVITGRLGMFDVAADLFAGAIQAEPDNPSYHNNLGNVLREQGRSEEALASFERAVAFIGIDLADRGSRQDYAIRSFSGMDPSLIYAVSSPIISRRILDAGSGAADSATRRE